MRINKRQFILIVLAVFLLGSAGLVTYAYVNLGGEYAKERSKTVTGQPEYLYSISTKGNAKLSKPLSVAVSGKNVYVADSANGKLAIFTRKGSLVNSVKLLKDAIPYPLGIALDERGRIYISIEVKGFYYIMVVDGYGRFLGKFPGDSSLKAGDQPVLNHPMGLFYQDNKLYVTDTGDHDVKVLSTADGKLLKRFGRAGYTNGEFMFPHGIAADEKNIYVVDSNNSRVQVFDKNGKFKYLFKPDKKQPLVIPRGIAIDSLGRVHVVDLAQSKVFVFTKEGKYLLSYGAGRGGEALAYPNGIAIDSEAGLIYIADRQNDRIAVFSE
ncbi:MAG: 6-bladed beta-propeller [Actinobacteria bacterium]|nr:6-bladed beta-propeller [Actinomycetota bacterium]